MTFEPVITVVIFLGVLFFYTHLTEQWRKSEELEIYEADYRTPSQLQDLCAVGQPFLMNLGLHQPRFFDKVKLKAMESCHGIDVYVQDTDEYWVPCGVLQQTQLPLSGSLKIMKQENKYVAEYNSEFINECGYETQYESMDALLKPSLCIYRNYDLCFGSKNAYLPMRYHHYSRRFIAVTDGKIHVKMSPWKCKKYLHAQTDWETLDHRSPVDLWRAQAQPQYISDREKVRCLAFDILPGHVLFVPPYWWYSIQYADTPDDTTLAIWTYSTAINALAHADEWARSYLELQQQKAGPLASASPIAVKPINVPDACLPQSSAKS
jgi:hypothetical protein